MTIRWKILEAWMATDELADLLFLLLGYDQFMNIVLDNTVEIVSPTEKNEIGMVVIRGHRRQMASRLSGCLSTDRLPQDMMLMGEVPHHLACRMPYQYWHKLPANSCRVSSKNSICQYLWVIKSMM